MMWWAVWCAVVVAGGSLAAAAPAPDAIQPMDMVQIDPSTPDDEALGYAIQPMAGRYAGAPWLYFLTDMPHDAQVGNKEWTRTRRSFSVNPAVELLQRGALFSYIGRVAQDNRNYLNRVGKRDHWNVSEDY